MGVAHGGQLLVSGATASLVTDAVFDGVDLSDLGEHRLRDLARPMRVYQVHAPGLRSEFPPLAVLDAFPSNLPLQTTTFVGRDDDVAEVGAALAKGRLVTLIGVGGVGKTRLALQTAAEVLPSYRDGVWLCELGPLSDPAQVPDVVADALGMQQRPGQSITESLVVWLRSKELLVVLDNVEHLLDAAARLVAAIVESCPGVRVLATGREGLGVRGERMMMVRSLPVPGADATTEEILSADAVALFTQRAEHAGAALDLDADTAATVAQLCRRLDGIPLAIELAAARSRMMSPEEIAGRLDERFRLLTGGARTAVERHHTLQQAVDWSYDLLDERERLILDRLGVFSGGFTLAAAEAVVGGDDLDPLDVLDGIALLVDKSLVDTEREHHDTRYRLLETIRSYTLERLDDRGGTDTMRRRHASWCADFVAQVSVGVRGRDEAAWWARLDSEVDNLRATLTWATGADDADLSMALTRELRVLDLLHPSPRLPARRVGDGCTHDHRRRRAPRLRPSADAAVGRPLQPPTHRRRRTRRPPGGRAHRRARYPFQHQPMDCPLHGPHHVGPCHRDRGRRDVPRSCPSHRRRLHPRQRPGASCVHVVHPRRHRTRPAACRGSNDARATDRQPDTHRERGHLARRRARSHRSNARPTHPRSRVRTGQRKRGFHVRGGRPMGAGTNGCRPRRPTMGDTVPTAASLSSTKRATRAWS